MSEAQMEFVSTGRKRFYLILLLPIVMVLLVMQSMIVLGQDELPMGDGSPAQINAAKTTNSESTNPGGWVRYTIVISNSGGTSELGMVMTDSLPVEFDIVEGSLISETTQGFTDLLEVTDDVVTWEGALGSGGEVKIVFNAILTDTAVAGSIITNTAVISGPTAILSPTAAIEVINEYRSYLPVIFKSLPVPSLSSVGKPTSNNGFASYDMLVSWADVNQSGLTYEVQEATEPTFANPTVIDAGTATSHKFNHESLLTYKFYYRVRTVDASKDRYSGWSNTQLGYGVYRDNFNDSGSGWAMRREDTDDTNNSVSYGSSRLKLKIGGRWDSMIASPLVPTPPDWSAYRINTSVDLGDGIDYLQSYGIVFGGDWDGTTPCPNSNFSSCFNRYYRLNVVWQGSDRPFRVHLKRIDAHDTSNNTDTGETLMTWRDAATSDPDGFNDWTIDVHDNGLIIIYINGNEFYRATDTNYVGGGRYFGGFASSVEYLGTAAFYEYWEVEPIP